MTTSPLDDARASVYASLRALPGFQNRELPRGLSEMHGAHGGKDLSLRAWGFRAHGVAYGRCVAIDGPGIWIENTVVFPDPALALPVLGVELLVFRDRMHLVVADLFPLADQDAGLMDGISPRYDHLGSTPPMPAWAARIFSRAPIFRKPRSEDALAEGARAMLDVSGAWLARRSQAEACAAPAAACARERLLGYIQAHAADEPAKPFLARAFGPLGERLVGEVLFPENILSEGQPS